MIKQVIRAQINNNNKIFFFSIFSQKYSILKSYIKQIIIKLFWLNKYAAKSSRLLYYKSLNRSEESVFCYSERQMYQDRRTKSINFNPVNVIEIKSLRNPGVKLLCLKIEILEHNVRYSLRDTVLADSILHFFFQVIRRKHKLR